MDEAKAKASAIRAKADEAAAAVVMAARERAAAGTKAVLDAAREEAKSILGRAREEDSATNEAFIAGRQQAAEAVVKKIVDMILGSPA